MFNRQQEESKLQSYTQPSSSVNYYPNISPETSNVYSIQATQQMSIPFHLPKPTTNTFHSNRTKTQNNKQNNKQKYKHHYLPTNTNPLNYLYTHNTITKQHLKQLIKMRGSRISKTSLHIKGIYKIGNYLWLLTKVYKRKHNTQTFYKKITPHKFSEWLEWIPKQEQIYTNCWRKLSLRFYDSAQAFKILIIENPKHIELSKCGDWFRSRLLNFFNALRKLYAKGVKSPQICWRCGKTNHYYRECRSTRDIVGNLLCKHDISCPFKPPNKSRDRDKNAINYCPEQLPPCVTCGCVKCQCQLTHRKQKYYQHNEHTQSVDKKQIFSFASNSYQNHNQNQNQMDNLSIANKRKRQCDDVGTDDYKPACKKQRIDIENKIEIKIEAERIMLNCSNCNVDLRNKDVWRCSKCKSSFYCNKKCQLLHWVTHKMECGSLNNNNINIKIERVGVNDWNHYAIIYWLNRVNDEMFNDVEYMDLRKHIVIGKIKGCDLKSINNITLRMMGINDMNKQEIILNAISDVVMNDNFDNLIANRMKTDDIPIKYIDAVLYELMDDAVKVMQSGYIYNKSFVAQYIEENKSDPITHRYTDLSDIVPCKELNLEIEMWKKKNLIIA